MRLAQRVSRIQPSATLAISAKARALRQQGTHVVNFGVGEPDFGTPLHIQEAAIKAIRDGHTRYTPVSGIDALKEAICDTIKDDYRLAYKKENVLVTCGGKHALYNLFQVLLDAGDEVIIPSPYWVSYPEMVALAEGTPVMVPCLQTNNFKLHPADLERAITPNTRLLILNSPSNPTGAHYTRKELEGLAEVLLRHPQVLIVSDDIYYRILFSGQEWVSMGMLGEELRSRMFIVNGVSKTYCMTGWRIGYLVGDQEVVRAATKIQGQSTTNATSIAQYAALAALRGDQSLVKTMREAFEERCHYVMGRLGELPGVSCPSPAGAFYVFPNFSCFFGKSGAGKVILNSLTLADYLMDHAHVAAVPGGPFGEDQCLRLSYALSMDDLQEGFDRISQAMLELS